MTPTSEWVKAAVRLYGSDEVEINDDATVSKAPDGAWVAAWVWVPNEAVE